MTSHKLSTQEHIRAVGRTTYHVAYIWARYAVGLDARLIGLGKIRKAIATEAALRATGFPFRPFQLPRDAGRPDQDIQNICEQVLDRATACAHEHCAIKRVRA